jgi:L-threonylcarbamoyladenylate synthase
VSSLIDCRGDLNRAVTKAVTCLEAGGVVVLPTDTVYGLAALAAYSGAVDRLFSLKQRSEAVPISVLVGDVEQAGELGRLSELDRVVARALWPGPLTLVIPARRWAVAARLAAADDTIGVRCPAETLVRQIARRAGPIATTSANRHGRPTPTTAGDAGSSLAGAVDLVIDGGTRSGAASTVATIGPPLVVHRLGALSEASLRAAVRS